LLNRRPFSRDRVGFDMKIAVMQGHPDARGGRFCHALAEAYAQAAMAGGHELTTVDVARLDFPLLRSAVEWQEGVPPQPILEAQEAIAWAEHLVLVFPLWLGDMPALLKAFLEQALRPGFAIGKAGSNRFPKGLLKGRSARLIVTMGMPAFFYRIFYRAHSVKSLRRNMLEFCGIAPVRTTLVGTVDSAVARQAALAKIRKLGRIGK
jgi:putative NADPH-quinone reductase